MGQPLVWRHLVKLPQDRKVARVYGLWRVHGGSFRTRLPAPASALCASESPAKVSYVTTALYRRYRPETFQDVIGQEHVTEPLMTALRKNRVNHAYLFSGPRGCGKTTSARILARCLNCAEGPTATPCGHCESCQDLARDGAGSLDVIEMDAASHGGVDHARDLRERATFAPVRDRYKIFIIDEAHMVTREGFNALLKIVEEPPEHVKFIFATTEPSKVLTTIRSRTHHYPFRLVPPEPLMRYLEQLCQEEGVTTEPGVLSLVVRAGGGSVRDSLSVLDQLMAGSDDSGITYDLAVALLGYTHAALLDDVVDAFAAGAPPRSSRPWTASSKPGRTPAVSWRTCSNASATWWWSTRSPIPPRTSCTGCPRTRSTGCGTRPPSWARPSSPAPRTSPTRPSTR